MAGDSIPDKVRRFILTSIPSVPFLEAMLLLRRDPEAVWDAGMLAQRIYVSEKQAEALLHELRNAGFATCVENDTLHYRFQSASTELNKLCAQLADVYAAHLIEVSNLIHSNISKQAQQFADAFKWRKD